MGKSKTAPTRLQLASTVAKHVDLLDVALASIDCELEVHRSQAQEFDGWKLEWSVTADYEFHEVELPDDEEIVDGEKRQGLLEISASFEIIVTRPPVMAGESIDDDEEEDETVLEFDCAFDLTYAFRAINAPRIDELEDHFQAFADLNGVFNAWPYLRELVQSTTTRMGIAPLVLAPLRIAQLAKD